MTTESIYFDPETLVKLAENAGFSVNKTLKVWDGTPILPFVEVGEQYDITPELTRFADLCLQEFLLRNAETAPPTED